MASLLSITLPSPNYLQIATAGEAPAFQSTVGTEITLGAATGNIASQTTLSLINGPCSNAVTVNIPFLNCTTDYLKPAPWVGTGDNLVQDNNGDRNEDGSVASMGLGNCIDGKDNDADGDKDGRDTDTSGVIEDPGCNNDATDTNGLPTYCDHWPSYLSTILADAAGNVVRPRLRLEGHQVILANSPASQLNFLVFTPSTLETMASPNGDMGDGRGFVNRVILNNTEAPVSPSKITDFCTSLATTTTRYDETQGEWAVKPGPEPYEASSSFSQQCLNSTDDDIPADGYVNDGCLYIPDPCNGLDDDSDGTVDEGCGIEHRWNPEPLTGLYGTGSQMVGAWIWPQLDGNASTHALSETAIGDGVENNLDTCPLRTNVGDPRTPGSGDPDYDGMDSVCDPSPNTSSPGAPPPDGVNQDGDGKTDEDPVDNADNDGDTLIDEDGECPVTSGLPDQDQDCYPNRLDLCPLVADNQLDTDKDGIGNACEPDWNGDTVVSNEECISGAANCTGTTADHVLRPDRKDGHTHYDMPFSASCVPDPEGSDDTDSNGDSDDDDDGWCDSTEVLLGSDPDNASKTPEYMGLAYDALPGAHVCTNYNPLAHPNGTAIDEDGDGKANAADNDAKGCICSTANDTDCDGVCDPNKTSTWCALDLAGAAGDNCINDDNPEQTDSDGDGLGDACDDDDDNDGATDAIESYMGTDPKDDCSDPAGSSPPDPANPWDYDSNQVVDVSDALIFLGKFPSAVSEGDEGWDYDRNGVVDVSDALIFLGKFPSSTVPTIVITNNSGAAATRVDIEFHATITDFKSISGGTGTWTKATALPNYDLRFNGGSVPNGGTLTISLVGMRHPVPREITWTP
jgi:hypothetical protein